MGNNVTEMKVENIRKSWTETISKLIKACISNTQILSLTIYKTLLMQNDESNPGMNKKDTFSIVTFNCNGLGDRKKLKRLLIKLEPIVNRGGIIFLQETHLTDTN
jgi:hypothetical protein